MWRGAMLVVGIAACRLHFEPLDDAAVPIGGGGFVGLDDAYIKASRPGMDDHFGEMVALSADGATLAVGAPGEDSGATGIDGDQSDNTVQDAGAVYVFSLGTAWTQQAYIKPSATMIGANFGKGLAIAADGSTLAVGAPSETSDTGRVYVFQRSGGTWAQQAIVDATNPDVGDVFGESVALSADGNTLAVGAQAEASNANGINGDQLDNTQPSSGAVYVYTRAGTTWTLQAYIKAAPSGAGDGFGYRVALSSSGDTLACTAQGEDSIKLDSGRAYVFTRAGATWSQQASLKASNPGDTDRLQEVTLSGSGDWLAIGAAGEDSAATGIDGDQNDDSATQAGAAYVFSRAGTTWTQRAYVKASNTDAGDRFGRSVAFSGDGSLLAIGAPGEDSGGSSQGDNAHLDAGAVYIFSLENGVPAQRLYLKAPNADGSDAFGTSLAFSATGSSLAVGAWFEDSNATGIGGNGADNSRADSGAAYVFR